MSLPPLDALVVLSAIGAIVTMINQTLVRKKRWEGWALAIPNICFFMYVNWRAGAYGYALLLGPFWLVNAVWALREWRRDDRRAATPGPALSHHHPPQPP